MNELGQMGSNQYIWTIARREKEKNRLDDHEFIATSLAQDILIENSTPKDGPLPPLRNLFPHLHQTGNKRAISELEDEMRETTLFKRNRHSTEESSSNLSFGFLNPFHWREGVEKPETRLSSLFQAEEDYQESIIARNSLKPTIDEFVSEEEIKSSSSFEPQYQSNTTTITAQDNFLTTANESSFLMKNSNLSSEFPSHESILRGKIAEEPIVKNMGSSTISPLRHFDVIEKEEKSQAPVCTLSSPNETWVHHKEKIKEVKRVIKELYEKKFFPSSSGGWKSAIPNKEWYSEKSIQEIAMRLGKNQSKIQSLIKECVINKLRKLIPGIKNSEISSMTGLSKWTVSRCSVNIQLNEKNSPGNRRRLYVREEINKLFGEDAKPSTEWYSQRNVSFIFENIKMKMSINPPIGWRCEIPRYVEGAIKEYAIERYSRQYPTRTSQEISDELKLDVRVVRLCFEKLKKSGAYVKKNIN